MGKKRATKPRKTPTAATTTAAPPPSSTETTAAPPPSSSETAAALPLSTYARIPTSSPRLPWPKPERQKIKSSRVWEDSPKVETEKSACINRPILDQWDDYDTLFYNAWLSVPMTPTRLLDLPTLDKLGITTDVLSILEKVGLGNIATTKHTLYPDLARQLLSTCRVYYDDDSNKVAQDGVLTFMCRGMRYRLAIPDLCDIYGFDSAPTKVTLPDAWVDIDKFWETLGTGMYRASRSTIKDIRHPAVRFAARILGTTILCKTDVTRARREDITLLSAGLCHLYPPEFWESADPCADLNLGAVFAHHLTMRKTTAFTSRPSETIGSLLTPIFEYLQIDTSNASLVSTDVVMDMQHLKYITWMKKEHVWIVSDSDARSWLVQLPQPDLTNLQNAIYTQLRFEVPRNLAKPTPLRIRRPRQQGSVDSSPPHMSFPEPPTGYDEDPPAFRRYVVSTIRQMWELFAATPTDPHTPIPSHTDDNRASTSTAPATPDDTEDHEDSTEEDVPQLRKRPRRSGI